MAAWSRKEETQYQKLKADKPSRSTDQFKKLRKKRQAYRNEQYNIQKRDNPEQTRFFIPITDETRKAKPSSGNSTFGKLGDISKGLFGEAIEKGTTAVVVGTLLYAGGAALAGAGSGTGATVGGTAATGSAAGGGANAILGAGGAGTAGGGFSLSSLLSGGKTALSTYQGIASLLGGGLDAYGNYQSGKFQAEQFALQAEVNRNQMENLALSIPLAQARADEARRRATLISGRADEIEARAGFHEDQAASYTERAGILTGRSADSLILAAKTEEIGIEIFEEGTEKAGRRLEKGEFDTGKQTARAAGGDVSVKSTSLHAIRKKVQDIASTDAKWVRDAAAREKFAYDTKAEGLRDLSEDQAYQATNLLFQATASIYAAEDLRWSAELLRNLGIDYQHNAMAYDIEIGNIMTQIENLGLTADYADAFAGSISDANRIGLGADLFDIGLDAYGLYEDYIG